jgi:hypothetical protein
VATELYRYFGESGELLYIGISRNSVVRSIQHSEKSHWFDDAVNMTIERLETREDAIAAERVAIQEERPIYNQVHNRSNPARHDSVRPEPRAGRDSAYRKCQVCNRKKARVVEYDKETGWWATCLDCELTGGYWVDLDEFNNDRHEWFRHLSEKNWVNLADFLEAATGFGEKGKMTHSTQYGVANVRGT